MTQDKYIQTPIYKLSLNSENISLTVIQYGHWHHHSVCWFWPYIRRLVWKNGAPQWEDLTWGPHVPDSELLHAAGRTEDHLL